MEKFYKAIGILEEMPHIGVEKGYWKIYCEQIQEFINLIHNHLDDSDEDGYFYDYDRVLVNDIYDFVSDKDNKEDLHLFVEKISTSSDELISIMDRFDGYDAFGTEGWRHLVGWD